MNAPTKTIDGDQVKYATGSVRTADAEGTRYTLITPIGLRRVAETYHEGAVKYTDHNWLQGMPIEDCLEHAVRHVYAYLSGDRAEDHLAHAAWNLLTACHSEEAWPELNGNLRGPGCTPPREPLKWASGDVVDEPEKADGGFLKFGSTKNSENDTKRKTPKPLAHIKPKRKKPKPNKRPI